MTTDPARTRLLHLLDRLRRGVLLPAERDLLADTVTTVLAELEQAAIDAAYETEGERKRADRAGAAEERAHAGAVLPERHTHMCPGCKECAEAARCCVCGSTHVAYHNYAGQPFCGPCAGCGCGQTPCTRTGINDPAVSAEAAEPDAEPETVHAHLTHPQPLLIRIDLHGIDQTMRDIVRRHFRTPRSPT